MKEFYGLIDEGTVTLTVGVELMCYHSPMHTEELATVPYFGSADRSASARGTE